MNDRVVLPSGDTTLRFYGTLRNRSYLIFLGDRDTQHSLNCLIGTNQPGGAVSDYIQPNLMYDFHVYPGPDGCGSSSSVMWTQYPTYTDQVSTFAHNGGHGISISEMGGKCNTDGNGYNTAMTGYSANHSEFMMYYDESNLASYNAPTDTYTITSVGLLCLQGYAAW